MKSLISNISSQYLQAANSLQKRKKKRIVAYVESYDDIFFWRSVLGEFETEERFFEVMLPSHKDLGRGKKVAMMNRLGEQLGECMIACVDADLDYLLQGRTNHSAQMLRNPYVIHTYAYSIENLQCYAPSLHTVCVMATLNDRKVFDFEQYLRSYSQIIYDLFVWAIWLYRQTRFSEFTLTALNNHIAIERMNISKPEEALENLRHRVNRKISWMQHHYPEAKGKLKPLREELAQLGITPDNTYLYIQGHHLMDNVVSAVLDPVCTILRREREKEIKNLSHGNNQQMDNELSCYQHSQAPVVQMLRRNTAYKDCEPFLRIIASINALLGKMTKE